MRSPERMSASPSSALGEPVRGRPDRWSSTRGPRLRPALLVAATILYLGGCATLPEYEPRDLLSYLPESHNGYVSVAPSREPFFSETLLRAFGFEEGDAKRITDRTERAYLGIGPDQNFSLIALGRYPDRSVARSLRRQGWEELPETVGETTWVNPEAAFRITRVQSDLYFISTTDSSPVGEGPRLPEAELSRFVSASLGFYAPEPGRNMLAGLMGRGELPIRDVYVEFLPLTEEEVREVVATVSTRSEKDARTLLVITRLLVVGTLNAAGIGFDEIPDSLTVEREGNQILLDGLFLREGQIARLFLERVPSSRGDVVP